MGGIDRKQRYDDADAGDGAEHGKEQGGEYFFIDFFHNKK
jgi:hypothetical protein